MLIQFLVSMFGIAFVYRILSRLEKTDLVSSSKLNLFFCFLQLPYYFYLFFKELFVFVIIYIGIFFIILMLFDKIIDYFKEKSFEELHIHLIERVILLLKSGRSAQVSTKNIFNELTHWQKSVFAELNTVFDLPTSKNLQKNSELRPALNFQSYYFQELKTILCSTNHVVDQLKSFQMGLRLQNNLRHKSRQAVQQTKAQALVSWVIYLSFIVLSSSYLKLELISLTMLSSLVLFLVGQLLIFRIGGKIRWKT